MTESLLGRHPTEIGGGDLVNLLRVHSNLGIAPSDESTERLNYFLVFKVQTLTANQVGHLLASYATLRLPLDDVLAVGLHMQILHHQASFVSR
eukprot:CAMPEP_0173467700 /NCGR_PEP_ID=MMETSP1357-20121228/75537_1 /TAXON_ID=77926 /ORGANISM="Hemiselmis rufescens, Strain PCC563" /LENGTH=92 /DNA_ID=CAMNT_0014435855 /DNA_START=10 /DNA_END=284 /DNA_ORIENTATION=-